MRFTIVILGLVIACGASAQNLTVADPNASTSDEALIQAAEKMISDTNGASSGASASAAEENPVDRTPPAYDEGKMPVLMKSNSETKASNDVYTRLVLSLGFLLIVAGALYYATRRWRRMPDKGGQSARVEMVHQFHVGPRRSIALIRVAGETMLVGITDHNISMLKSISLIDDELEGVIKKHDFNNFLEDEFSIEDVRTALRP